MKTWKMSGWLFLLVMGVFLFQPRAAKAGNDVSEYTTTNVDGDSFDVVESVTASGSSLTDATDEDGKTFSVRTLDGSQEVDYWYYTDPDGKKSPIMDGSGLTVVEILGF